ncbi:unnamed protein product [Acanthoscelides obtectus]|uniref:Peptidase S1 domain-containing protein n=1 Tax=Acanthoscelides obtectus TaxID=200917 RepID=A0A9P0K8J1_ACAOB|nr:unnamed protein product [Acanthoscelides obtectus]CAK1634244.1 Trypsin-7 [Acanthoscelides obtectus]
MAKLPVTLTICIAFLNLSSANKFGARIRGGDEAKIEDYPYQVALWYNGQWGKCGGSIISPNWILTAAHCVFLNRNKPELMQVLGNSAKFDSKSGVLVSVKQIICHDKWDPERSLDYDIALLELSEPIKCPNCKPIQLDTEGPKANEKAVITGWGLVNETTIAQVLQGATVLVIEQTICQEWLSLLPGMLTERMFCAGYPDGGITSWGTSSCYAKPKSPGVYSKVSAYYDWIQRYTGITF